MSNTQADYSRFEKKVKETKGQRFGRVAGKGQKQSTNEASVIAMLCLACTRPASLIPIGVRGFPKRQKTPSGLRAILHKGVDLSVCGSKCLLLRQENNSEVPGSRLLSEAGAVNNQNMFLQ